MVKRLYFDIVRIPAVAWIVNFCQGVQYNAFIRSQAHAMRCAWSHHIRTHTYCKAFRHKQLFDDDMLHFSVESHRLFVT